MPLSLSATAWLEICSLEQIQRHDLVRVQTVSQWVTVTSKSKNYPMWGRRSLSWSGVVQKEICSRVSSRDSFWLGLAVCFQGREDGEGVQGEGSCLYFHPDYSGLIIHFMDSLALCLSSFLRDFWLLVMLLFSWYQILEKRIKIMLPYVSNSY